jgi:16S rRNA processing protein RimM
MSAGEKRVCVGQLLGAHGVRGLVKLASFTADPAAIADYGALTDADGKRAFTVVLRGANKGHWLAEIAEVKDREAAQALNGTRLFALRAQLPPPGEEEFYHADLIGLRAELPDGTALGTVAAMHNFGAGDIVELALPGGQRPMLPFGKETVPVIDIAGGRMVVDPPDGLLDSDGNDRVAS